MPSVVWDPTAQQVVEDDTIFFFDPALETGFTQGVDGFNDTAGTFVDYATCNPWRVGGTVQTVAGKYLNGVRGSSAGSGIDPLWMPGIWLPRDEWTIEFWVRNDNDWAAVGAIATQFLAFGLDPIDGVGSNWIGFRSYNDNNYRMQFTWANRTVSPADSGRIVDTHDPLAGEWVNYAATYKNNTLTLYRNGVQVGSPATGVDPPFAWSGDDKTLGINILGWAGAADNSRWTLSDLRVSRYARVPGVATTISSSNSITINDTTTGKTVNQRLRGGLHNFASVDADIGDATVEGLAAGLVQLARTGKFLAAVPIKAGVPDADHPTLGHSGSYSYDWRPVDHQLDVYARLGIELYLNMDACPQIFGGTVAPFTPAQCADPTHLPSASGYSNAVPNDFNGYATVAADLYHYITVTKATPIVFCGFGNEPDGGTSFWAGTQTQWFQLYAATANAIAAIDPNVNIGGPEISDPTATSWISGLISYCATNGVPLKHISYHHYLGDHSNVRYMKQQIASWVATYGLPNSLDLLIGEAAIQSYMVYPTVWPWRKVGFNYGLNDWAGSYTATLLMACQDADVKAQIHTNLVPTESTDTGWNSLGLISHTHRWINANIYDLWSKLGTDVLELAGSDLENGVTVLASKAADGRTTVLIANHKYRKDRTTTITLTLPARVDAFDVTHYVVDSSHSNYFDQGAGTGALEAVTAPEVVNSTVTLTMAPRSVHLLELTVPSLPPATVDALTLTPASTDSAAVSPANAGSSSLGAAATDGLTLAPASADSLTLSPAP